MKEESEEVGLKLNIQKTKIMASGSITSCQIAGETIETVADFILGGSKITASERGIWGFISGQHHEPRPNKVPPIQYVLKNTCGNNE